MHAFPFQALGYQFDQKSHTKRGNNIYLQNTTKNELKTISHYSSHNQNIHQDDNPNLTIIMQRRVFLTLELTCSLTYKNLKNNKTVQKFRNRLGTNIYKFQHTGKVSKRNDIFCAQCEKDKISNFKKKNQNLFWSLILSFSQTEQNISFHFETLHVWKTYIFISKKNQIFFKYFTFL